MEAASEMFVVAMTTRLECIVARSLTRGKNKKRSIQTAKADFETRTKKDPASLVYAPLWKLADVELAAK
eukprot:6110161-Lingulodinium_polyedra.AAC.1